MGVTSNLVSSGLRETIRYLVEHKHVTVLVATAGAIEEDLIKCLAPTYRSTFNANDAELRENAINRIGNLRVPNDNYVLFEEWIMPVLERLLAAQEERAAAKRDLEISIQRRWILEHHSGQNTEIMISDQRKLADFPALGFTPSSLIAELGTFQSNASLLSKQS